MFKKPLTRRQALAGLGSLAAAGAADAFGLEPNWLEVTSHEFPITGLPRKLDGFKLAQVTDAHLDGLGPVEERILSVVREQEIQLLVLTGDIIDSVSSFDALRELCSQLARTPAAVVATLGNWERWQKIPLDQLARLYREFGIQLLVNDHTLIEGISVSGTDDATAGQVDFNKAVPPGQPAARILLTHSPGLLDATPATMPAMDLTLAGHTHGGQVRLGSVIPFVPPGSGRFRAGWYQTRAGASYVSRGTGTSIAPIRFTCRPELPVFQLRQA